MNVLIINPILATPTATGLQRLASIKDTMIYGMALGFISEGHKPTLIAAEDFRPERQEKYDFPVVFLPTKTRRVFNPSLLPWMPSLRGWLRCHGSEFDVIITKECFSLASLTAARLYPRKTILWQELAAHQRKFHRLPSRIWHSLVARPFMRGVKAVGCSPAARDFLRHYLPDVAEETIEHGIDDRKFRPFERKERTLITSSQLIPRKNVGSILRKFASLHAIAGYEDIRLIVCGDGVERESLERLASELGITSYVDFKGFLPREELGRLVARSLAFLVDTKADLNVISIVESVAAGTPVVTNRVPLTAPWIESEGLGIARDGWDAADLAALIDDASRYAARCRAAALTLSSAAAARRLLHTFEQYPNHC